MSEALRDPMPRAVLEALRIGRDAIVAAGWWGGFSARYVALAFVGASLAAFAHGARRLCAVQR
jgi:hypothetical protein